MKKLLLFFALFCAGSIYSCPVCERQQPKIIRGIVHGKGPDTNWDYVIVCSIGLITLLTFYYSIKRLIMPGEKNPGHIKYIILNTESNEPSK